MALEGQTKALAVAMTSAACILSARTKIRAYQKSLPKVDVRKFSEYIFKEGADHGKAQVFENLGYSKRHSEFLSGIYQKQAQLKFLQGDYTLGKLDQYGQRINIEIQLPGIESAAGKTIYLRSGWMILENGNIQLTTPFSGYTR